MPIRERKTIDGEIKVDGTEDSRRIHLCSTVETWSTNEGRERKKGIGREKEKRIRNTNSPWVAERHQIFLKAIRRAKDWCREKYAENIMEERGRLRKRNGEVEIRVK